MINFIDYNMLLVYVCRGNMQKQLFRQYDIRGKIGTQISVVDFYDLAHALVVYFKQQGCNSLVIGMDGRVSGPEIFHQIQTACRDAGINLYVLGVCSTPIAVFAQYHLPVDGMIMITASHNPAEYNGLKIYYKKVAVEGERLQQIYHLFMAKQQLLSATVGIVFDASYLIDTYINSLVLEFEHLKNLTMPVFVDCGNGTGGPIIRRLIHAMGWTSVQILYERVDGTYPNHIADPTEYENVKDLIELVATDNKACGIGLDGDCDRVAVVTPDKKLVPADQLLTLFARSIKANILIADIKSSSIVYQAGAQVILTQTGSANIKTVMQEHAALVGGELSGHFFFKDRHAGYDDGIYGMLRFLEILVTESMSCQQLVASLPVLYVSPDIRIFCSDAEKFVIVDAIKKKLMTNDQYDLNLIDGVRFADEYGWALIRASNTQPALSVCYEAASLQTLPVVRQRLLELLQDHINLQHLEHYFS